MTDGRIRRDDRYPGYWEDVPVDEARCPECGNETGNYTVEARDGAQPVPPGQRGRCPECEHSDDPLAFHHEWKWERMSEDEREEARRKQAQYEDQMADYQYSAHYISMQREP